MGNATSKSDRTKDEKKKNGKRLTYCNIGCYIVVMGLILASLFLLLCTLYSDSGQVGMTLVSVNGTQLGTAPGKIFHFAANGWYVELERHQTEEERKHNGPGTIPNASYSSNEFTPPYVDHRR